MSHTSTPVKCFSCLHPWVAGFHVLFLVLWTQFYSLPEQQKIMPVVDVMIVVKLYVSFPCLYICELAYLFLPFMTVCDCFEVMCCSCGNTLPVMTPTVLPMTSDCCLEYHGVSGWSEFYTRQGKFFSSP
jgi:hypothetical protein